MQLKTIAGLVLAALVVTGTAAALPGNAPAQADEHANDDAETANATEPRADSDETNESAGRPDNVPAANDGERGPPTEMPGAVPDFVGEMHSLIDQKIAGELDGSLGEQVSDLTPDDETETDSESDDETETADDETETNSESDDETETDA